MFHRNGAMRFAYWHPTENGICITGLKHCIVQSLPNSPVHPPRVTFPITWLTPFIDKDIESGTTYFYCLQDMGSNGARHESDVIRFSPPLPEAFALFQNYPNPFNPSTTIRYDVAEPSFVTLKVYDILGRHVRTLVEDDLKPGFHKVEWNGANSFGEAVASGVYHAVMQTKSGRFLIKMAIVR